VTPARPAKYLIEDQEKTISNTRHPASLSEVRIVHRLDAIQICRGIERQDELDGDARVNTCSIGVELAKAMRTFLFRTAWNVSF
jgi:hypothetical protein